MLLISRSIHLPRRVFVVALFCFASYSFAESYELDKYGGLTGIKGERTGFFHVEKINGQNWFVTPEGLAKWTNI